MRAYILGWVVVLGLAATAACDGDGADDSAPPGTGGKGGHSGTGGKGGAGSSGKGGAGKSTGGTGGGEGGSSSGKAGSGGSTTAGRGGTSGTAGTAGTDGGRGGTPNGGAGNGGMSGAGEGGLGGAGSGGDSGAGGSSATGGDSGQGGAGAGGESNLPESIGAHCTGCTRTKIGSPAWEPAGALAVVGDVGSTSADLFNAFLENLTSPDHAYDANDFIIGPNQQHAGPYNDELFTYAQAHSLTPQQTFTEAEFTAPSGVIIMMNIVPSAGAPVGSSFDFDSGPIIPNSVFPVTVDGDMMRNGVLYDAYFDSSYPGYPGMNPPIAKDGPSHMPWFFGEDSFFGPSSTPATGSYEFTVTISDVNGDGWLVKVPFTVTN